MPVPRSFTYPRLWIPADLLPPLSSLCQSTSYRSCDSYLRSACLRTALVACACVFFGSGRRDPVSDAPRNESRAGSSITGPEGPAGSACGQQAVYRCSWLSRAPVDFLAPTCDTDMALTNLTRPAIPQRDGAARRAYPKLTRIDAGTSLGRISNRP